MRASKIKNEPVTWLWKDRIPVGMLAVFAGRPGGGKSLLGIRMAADVSKRGNVLLSQTEDHLKHMVGPRLTAAKANRSRVIVDEDPIFPDDLDKFKKLVIRNNIILAIFDPVNEHLGSGVLRYNDSIRKATKPLKRIAEETGVAIVFVDHVIKNVSKNAHPLTAIGGASSGLAAAGRMVYIVGRDPEDKDRIMMCNVKTGLRDDPAPLEFTMDEDEVPGYGTMSLLIDGDECDDYDVMKLLAGPAKKGKLGRPPTKREAAHEFLIDYLAAAPNHERKAVEIIEDAKNYNITKRTLEAAKAEAEIESIKRQNEWWWKLPPELIEAVNASS